MERKVIFAPDEFYHIYNRGVDKRIIFSDRRDRERFLKILYLANSSKPVNFREQVDKKSTAEVFSLVRGETLVNIGAYCLMPNHFHLLMQEKHSGGISSFLKKLTTSYAMYFNKRYQRTGRLFENTFKSSHVDEDRYLKYLFAYIHLNPVKLLEPSWKEKGVQNLPATKKYLAVYADSSYLDYLNHDRPQKTIINQDSFPEYFILPSDFSSFINDWLLTKDDPL